MAVVKGKTWFDGFLYLTMVKVYAVCTVLMAIRRFSRWLNLVVLTKEIVGRVVLADLFAFSSSYHLCVTIAITGIASYCVLAIPSSN